MTTIELHVVLKNKSDYCRMYNVGVKQSVMAEDDDSEGVFMQAVSVTMKTIISIHYMPSKDNVLQ